MRGKKCTQCTNEAIEGRSICGDCNKARMRAIRRKNYKPKKTIKQIGVDWSILSRPLVK